MTKTDFDAKMSRLIRKITANKSKHLLVENELKKLKRFDSSYFIGKSHFEDGTQNYLVFQPIQRYFKRIAGVGNGNYIDYWKSKGFIVPSRVGTPTFLREPLPPPFSGYTPLSEANLKNYPSLSDSHPSWCMQIV